jgi:hypothetical protein
VFTTICDWAILWASIIQSTLFRHLLNKNYNLILAPREMFACNTVLPYKLMSHNVMILITFHRNLKCISMSSQLYTIHTFILYFLKQLF